MSIALVQPSQIHFPTALVSFMQGCTWGCEGALSVLTVLRHQPVHLTEHCASNATSILLPLLVISASLFLPPSLLILITTSTRFIHGPI